MSLAITGIPDCKAPLGPSQFLKGYQLQPGTADYPAAGYVIPGSLNAASAVGVTGAFEGQFAYGAWIMSSNLFAAQFGVNFIASPPSSTLTMIVTLQGADAGAPLGLGPLSALSTAIGVTSNVITVTMANTFSAGQFVLLRSFTAGAAINGTIVQIATASATQFTANYPTPNITAATADATGTAQLIQVTSGNALTAGTTATITNSLSTSSLLTMTCANSFIPGQFVIIQGLTNGATANGVIVQIATASATQFTANWTGTSFTTAADAGTARLLVTSGNAPVATEQSATITNSLATASSAGVAGVITLTAQQDFAPNNIVVIQGLTNGAAINGDILVINQASLTNASFVANHKTAAFTSAADTGTAALLVTGVPTGVAQVSPGTDLSGCTWFAQFLTGGE